MYGKELLGRKETKEILCAVIRQAVSDYASLCRRGIESATEKNYTYGKEEIEDFFNGTWGEWIIQDGLHMRRMNGSDFLNAAIKKAGM